MAIPYITIGNLYGDLAASVDHFRTDLSAVEASRARIEAVLADGEAHYGINTGFGALANKRIPSDQLGQLQRNLIQEDHVSMGSISAVKLLQVFGNVETVLAIELLTASQALDYRLPLQPGRGVEAAHRLIRDRITHREADYLFQEDLAKVYALIRGRELLAAAGMGV